MPNLINSNSTINRKVINSGLLTFLSHTINMILRLGSNLVLTRLLVPEMFGIMAIALVFTYIVTLISDIGIAPSIIRSERGNEIRFINTAWTLQVIRGFIISIIIALIGLIIMWANQNQLIADNSAYSEPVLPSVIALIALSSVIHGFMSTNVVTAQRNLVIGRLVSMELLSQVVGLIVMIAWAFLYKTVWALVIGALVSSTVKVILSHLIFTNGITNKFLWDKEAFKEIINFGKWIFISSLFTAFYVQGDRLILGSLISAKELGIYSIALFITLSVTDVLGHITGSVIFPALSETHRTSPDKVLSYYYKARKYFDAFTITLAALLYISGDTLIRFLYTDNYSDAGWMLQILSLTLIFKTPLLSTSMMFAIGQSKYSAILKGLQSCLLIIFFPLFYSIGGMKLAIWALVFVAFSSNLFDLYYRYKIGLFIFINEIRMFPMFIIGILLGKLFNYLILEYFTYTQ